MKRQIIALLAVAAGLSVRAASPVYVIDANGDHGCDTLADAYQYLQDEAVVDAGGALGVRICEGVTLDADISADLTGKSGLEHLVVEGGQLDDDVPKPRSDTYIRVTGRSLDEGKYAPTTAADVVNVRATLPSGAGLDVRNLHFTGSVQFDAGTAFDAARSVSVHDCMIDGGWYVASPAAGVYRFVNNEFTSWFEGAAVALSFAGVQTHGCTVDFQNNSVQCARALVIGSSAVPAPTVQNNVLVAGNTFLHMEPTRAVYSQHRGGICAGFCQLTGRVNGEVTVINNRVLGYFTTDEAVPALLSVDRCGGTSAAVSDWMAAGSTVTVSNNDCACNVAAVAYHGAPLDATQAFADAGATLADNRKVHLYPADMSTHATQCHLCAACREAIVRVEVKYGKAVSGVESEVSVPNYSGYGTDIGVKTAANAFVLELGGTNAVVCSSYDAGEGAPMLKSYVYEGTATDENLTDDPVLVSRDGDVYTLKAVNYGPASGKTLTRCPRMKIVFRQKYVRSSNTHASARVDTVSTNVLIAVPWSFYTPDGSPSSDLPVNRLVRPLGLSDGDMLLNVVDSKVYESWMLVKDATQTNWVSATSVTESVRVDPADVDLEAEPSPEKPMVRGTGLWLIRTDPKTEAGEWKPIHLYGQWTADGALVTVDGGTTGTNAVMVAHPGCTKALKVNEDITWEDVCADDTLLIPNGTDAQSLAVWDAEQQKWFVTTSTVVRKRVVYSRDYDISVPAGCGFWYVRRASSPVTIEFVQK